MVARAAWSDAPGIALSLSDLLALRDEVGGRDRHNPATRRPGSVPARLPGAGMDLREIRAYVPGDDLRRLDPSATARTGQPHVRSLLEDRDDTTLLIADFRAPMIWGTGAALRSVRAAHHLARTGWACVLRGGSLAALTLTDTGLAQLPAGQGDAQMAATSELLVHEHARALRQSGATDAPVELAQGLTQAARLAPAGGRILLATSPGGWTAAKDALSRLSRRRAVTVALIMDEIEIAAPTGILTIRDATEGANRRVRLHVPDMTAELAQLTALGAQAVEVRP